MGSDHVDLFQRTISQDDLLLIKSSSGYKAAVGIAQQAARPRTRYCFLLPPGWPRPQKSVGNGMTAVHQLPGSVLRGSELLFLRKEPPDRRGVKQNLCASQSE